MSDDEQMIEQHFEKLTSAPPRLAVSPWYIAERIVGWVTAVIAIASFVGVCFLSVQAATSTECTNKQLGSRSGLIAALIDDEKAYAAGQSAAVHELTGATTPQQASAALSHYQRATDDFTAASTQLANFSKSHPLGTC